MSRRVGRDTGGSETTAESPRHTLPSEAAPTQREHGYALRVTPAGEQGRSRNAREVVICQLFCYRGLRTGDSCTEYMQMW